MLQGGAQVSNRTAGFAAVISAAHRTCPVTSLSILSGQRSTAHGTMAAAAPAPRHHAINLSFPKLEVVHENPPIYQVDDLLTPEECKWLIDRSAPLLERAPVVKLAGDSAAARESSGAVESRTSRTCFLSRDSCTELLTRVCELTNKTVDCCELVQVGNYLPGQFYRPHYDSVDPHTDLGREFISNGGQRTITVLMYLNDVAEGGGTYFDRLGLRVRPKRGRAVIFFPSFLDGELDTQALHCAEDAVDEKWVSQIWIRETTRRPGQPSDV